VPRRDQPHQAERLGRIGTFPKAVRLGVCRYLRRLEFEAWKVEMGFDPMTSTRPATA
jgi:hypothetical protein